MIFTDIDWVLVEFHASRIGMAYLMALPIAWNREVNNQGAGLRTFPLVSVAACGFALLANYAFDDPNAQARVMQGLITGIGFIGGGAILKSDQNVSGTATAASIWITGAIGIATAWGRYDIAALLSIITFITLYIVAKLKPLVKATSKQADIQVNTHEQ